MFIISLTYKKPIEDVEEHLDEHIAFLEQAYKDGHFITSGRKVPRTGGIILSRVERKTELEEILARDPFCRHGIAELEITEFIPSMTANGFGNLMV